MQEVVDGSLHKIRHYQPQHYYLLDTLVLKIDEWPGGIIEKLEKALKVLKDTELSIASLQSLKSEV